ncbi:MAG: mechanosensitive ion channel family protein [Polyangia bacterium]
MAGPSTDLLLCAPAEWHAGAFWSNARAELATHPAAAWTGAILVLLLLFGRALLPPRSRPHLRTASILAVFYIVTIFARTELLYLGVADDAYQWVALAGVIALSFGVISTLSLLFFDGVLGRRSSVPRILRDVTTAVACGVLLVVLLSRSGVNVLHLVTTSAVITVVIGLALQDTLGNIISGIALQLDSAFNIGDWVRVDDKVTGKVQEIRWRSTLIETRNGDQVIFPNTLVNRAQVVRFQHGSLQHRQWVYFHAALRHPPNRVVDAVLQALVGTPNVSEVTPPDCIVWDFDDMGTKYAVRYRLVDIRPDDGTDSEVKKRIWYALHRAELEMTLPGRTVHLTQVSEEEGQRARDLDKRLGTLAHIAFLAPLDEAERGQLAAGLRFHRYCRGEAIIRQGHVGDSLFVLVKGTVSVRFDVGDSAHELTQLHVGDFFGEMSLLTGAPRRATVVAAEDVDCYVLDRALIEGVLKNNPALAEQIGKLLTERERSLAKEQERAKLGTAAPTEKDLLARIRDFFGLGE